jgi:hypothetical protein
MQLVQESKSASMPTRRIYDFKRPPNRKFGCVSVIESTDVGDMLLCAIAIGISILLFLITEKRKAAVGTTRLLL